LEGWFRLAVVFFLRLPVGSFCWSFLAALDARGHPFRFGVLQSNLGNVRHVEVFNSDDFLLMFSNGFFCQVSHGIPHTRGGLLEAKRSLGARSASKSSLSAASFAISPCNNGASSAGSMTVRVE
jgi:hypothetical protein